MLKIGDTIIERSPIGGYRIITYVSDEDPLSTLCLHDWAQTRWGARRLARRQRRNALKGTEPFREVIR